MYLTEKDLGCNRNNKDNVGTAGATNEVATLKEAGGRRRLALLTKGPLARLWNHCRFRCGVWYEVQEVALWHLRGLLLRVGPSPGSLLGVVGVTGGGGGRK